jgi:hypothetical protein
VAKKSREKGKRGERAAADKLRELYPDAKRTISQSRGAEDSDVGGTPWHVEVKIGKAPPIAPAMDQAIRDSRGERPPLVMSKKDRGDWLITMRYEDFLRICLSARLAGLLHELKIPPLGPLALSDRGATVVRSESTE